MRWIIGGALVGYAVVYLPTMAIVARLGQTSGAVALAVGTWALGGLVAGARAGNRIDDRRHR